ncbi:hypothetical protein BY457_11971 [Marinilabilia salmonicolor]|jgi:hypothetical protein|nr:hypothetical protein BY457_11971 [Marinilabilia salmonicolor]
MYQKGGVPNVPLITHPTMFGFTFIGISTESETEKENPFLRKIEP